MIARQLFTSRESAVYSLLPRQMWRMSEKPVTRRVMSHRIGAKPTLTSGDGRRRRPSAGQLR